MKYWKSKGKLWSKNSLDCPVNRAVSKEGVEQQISDMSLEDKKEEESNNTTTADQDDEVRALVLWATSRVGHALSLFALTLLEANQCVGMMGRLCLA